MENRGQLYDQSQFAELRSSNQGHASGYNDGFGAGLEAAMWLTFEVPRDSLQITSAHYVAPKIVVKKEHKNKTKKTPYAKPEDEPMRRIVVYKENLVDDSWEEMRPFGEGFCIHNMPPGYLQCSSCHVGFPDWYFLPGKASRKSFDACTIVHPCSVSTKSVPSKSYANTISH